MIKNILIFTIGTAVGGFAVYKYLEYDYEERLAEMESSSWEDEKETPEMDTTEEDTTEPFTEKDYVEYDKIATKYAAESIKRSEEKKDMLNRKFASLASPGEEDCEDGSFEPRDRSKLPYIITEDSFNEDYTEFDKISLVLYSDGVVVDEQDEVVIVPDTIGVEAIEYLENNRLDNVVYVRNERRASDYEMVRDNNTYAYYHE